MVQSGLFPLSEDVMSTALIGFGLMSLLGCLLYVVVGTIAAQAKERRLERDRADIQRLHKALRRLD